MPIYNLEKRRPKILLLGNGILRCAKNSVKWYDFLKENAVSEELASVFLYNEDGKELSEIPNTVLALLLCGVDDKSRKNKYNETLDNHKIYDDENVQMLISMFLSLKFDAILTTNYTYEIESVINSAYPEKSENGKRKFAKYYSHDPKYLIHTFNRVAADSPPIWHIHGEQRRKSSIILSHDEYARLTQKIIEHINKIGNGYAFDFNCFNVKSWVDYFIIADIYIVGFGFDYSEFDLWWLLNRRLREKNAKTGRIVFYDVGNSIPDYKTLALQQCNVECRNLGFNKPGIDYNDFYSSVFEDIKRELTENPEE